MAGRETFFAQITGGQWGRVDIIREAWLPGVDALDLAMAVAEVIEGIDRVEGLWSEDGAPDRARDMPTTGLAWARTVTIA